MPKANASGRERAISMALIRRKFLSPVMSVCCSVAVFSVTMLHMFESGIDRRVVTQLRGARHKFIRASTGGRSRVYDINDDRGEPFRSGLQGRLDHGFDVVLWWCKVSDGVAESVEPGTCRVRQGDST